MNENSVAVSIVLVGCGAPLKSMGWYHAIQLLAFEDSNGRLEYIVEPWALKPRLLHALKKMDTRLGPLVQCVTMYDSLGKMDVIREEYVKIRPVEVHA